jgi:hypothetical protein
VDFESVSRTEYFNVRINETEFWVNAIPISSITSVKHDLDGEFNGNESDLSDFYIGRGDRSVVLDYAVTPGKKVLQIVYTGGSSSQPTKSTFAISSPSGTFLKDKFARGSISGAVGIICANSTGTSIQIDNLYGTFVVGDVLAMQNTEGGTDVGGIAATIDSITVQSLAEVLPEVPLACEMQIRYNVKTKENFELTGIEKDKTSRRANQEQLTFRGAFQDLQPEVRSMLNKHRRITL